MENFDQTSLDDIFTGTRGSECFNPCLSTQTKVSIVEDRIASNDNSTTWIGLNFDQTVDITEYFYPEFSISDFLSSLGGALGQCCHPLVRVSLQHLLTNQGSVFISIDQSEVSIYFN